MAGKNIIPVSKFDAKNIYFNNDLVQKELAKKDDPKKQGVLYFPLSYKDEKNGIDLNYLKIQTTFMYLPYGVSCFVDDKNPNKPPQYSLSVGFQHTADPDSRNSPEKFEFIQNDRVEHLENQFKQLDVAVLKKVFESVLMSEEFKKVFPTASKYQKDLETLIEVVKPSSSYTAPKQKNDGKKRYPYHTMNLKIIFKGDPTTGEKKFYFDMKRRPLNSMKTEEIKGEDYENVFTEMKGAIARIQFTPQFWIHTKVKSCGIKCVVNGVEFTPFESSSSGQTQFEMVDDDDEEMAMLNKMAKMKVGQSSNAVEEETTEEEEEEEDAQEVEEEEEEEVEVEEEDEEVPEPEPEKPKRGGKGRKKA